jgi:hypothetical protein
MKVFISSVTYLLKDEREALPDFLDLLGHEGLRFEQFTAQDRSSRQACLAGVDEADVYVLLLGPKYGDPFPDTGLSPTAEEFTRARRRGIPVLVFNKTVDEPDDPAQVEFKTKVGHYVNGRLWHSFTDPLSCNQAVGEALRQLKAEFDATSGRPASRPLTIPWLNDLSASEQGPNLGGWGNTQRKGLLPNSVSAPVLELHVVPEQAAARVGATQLVRLADAMANEIRSNQFVGHSDPIDIGTSDELAWAIRPPEISRANFDDNITELFRGMVATTSGALGAFVCLQTDFMGALVNQESLQKDLALLVGLIVPHVDDSADVAVAAGLSNPERVWEGDPSRVGARNRGQMRMTTGAAVRVGGEIVVPARSLSGYFGDLGGDLSLQILQDLRSMR